VKENSKSMAKLPNTEGGGVSELRKLWQWISKLCLMMIKLCLVVW
jgi:hypothetical protein